MKALAISLAAIYALAFNGQARATTPTLEIVNMTKFQATVVVDRAGAPYGHYTIAPFGKVMVYGDGAFAFTGTVSSGSGSGSGAGISLQRKETTLVAGAQTRGLIIEVRGSGVAWGFGSPTSGAVM